MQVDDAWNEIKTAEVNPFTGKFGGHLRGNVNNLAIGNGNIHHCVSIIDRIHHRRVFK